jgi:ADP-ribose pyrophosphatase
MRRLSVDGIAGTWAVRNDEVIAETPFFSVRREQCRTPAGGELDYYLIDTADWANVVAVTEDLDLILVRQYRHAAREVTLEIPGGKLDGGEDAVAAATRELLEETGYRGPAVLVRSRRSNPALFGNRLSTVLCYPARKVAAPVADPVEQTVPVLVPAAEWLVPAWAAQADHCFTALAVHDVTAMMRPAGVLDRPAVADFLSGLTSARERGD